MHAAPKYVATTYLSFLCWLVWLVRGGCARFQNAWLCVFFLIFSSFFFFLNEYALNKIACDFWCFLHSAPRLFHTPRLLGNRQTRAAILEKVPFAVVNAVLLVTSLSFFSCINSRTRVCMCRLGNVRTACSACWEVEFLIPSCDSDVRAMYSLEGCIKLAHLKKYIYKSIVSQKEELWIFIFWAFSSIGKVFLFLFLLSVSK